MSALSRFVARCRWLCAGEALGVAPADRSSDQPPGSGLCSFLFSAGDLPPPPAAGASNRRSTRDQARGPGGRAPSESPPTATPRPFWSWLLAPEQLTSKQLTSKQLTSEPPPRAEKPAAAAHPPRSES